MLSNLNFFLTHFLSDRAVSLTYLSFYLLRFAIYLLLAPYMRDCRCFLSSLPFVCLRPLTEPSPQSDMVIEVMSAKICTKLSVLLPHGFGPADLGHKPAVRCPIH
jgi:hypothetical protein